MKETEKRRREIFDRYSNQLVFLIEAGIIKDLILEFEKVYICPICLRQFSDEALNQSSKNPLTLEDAPPKSLGGRAAVLTCRECNNSCGTKIDHHLTERLRFIDKSSFPPKSQFNINTEKDGRIVQGTVRIEADGQMFVTHKIENNHPTKLREYINSLMPQKIREIVTLKIVGRPVDSKMVALAFLKTAYLLAFGKFGYSLILDPCYNYIRENLRNPTDSDYPNRFCFQVPMPKESYGVHFITEAGMEGLLIIFPLITENFERPFITILPLPIHDINHLIDTIYGKWQSIGDFMAEMYPTASDYKYQTDKAEITAMLKWIEKRKNNYQ